jgi:hypothetical protein
MPTVRKIFCVEWEIAKWVLHHDVSSESLGARLAAQRARAVGAGASRISTFSPTLVHPRFFISVLRSQPKMSAFDDVIKLVKEWPAEAQPNELKYRDSLTAFRSGRNRVPPLRDDLDIYVKQSGFFGDSETFIELKRNLTQKTQSRGSGRRTPPRKELHYRRSVREGESRARRPRKAIEPTTSTYKGEAPEAPL